MGNEWADRAARQGTNNSTNSTHLHIPLSVNEIYCQLHSASQDYFNKCYQEKVLPDLHPPDTSHNCCKMSKSFNFASSKGSTMIRHFCHHKCIHPIKLKSFESLLYRFQLNAFRTKFDKNLKCICGAHGSFTSLHILFECPYFKSMVLK